MIGDLNKRVTIQHKTRVADGMGGFADTWNDTATVWAAIWPVSASDLIQAAQTTLVVTHRIRIRYRSTFKAAWRVKFGNRYFSIISVLNPNEKNEYLDLICKEAA
jgi:SPP1 family predicted phage head-tail adaptor